VAAVDSATHWTPVFTTDLLAEGSEAPPGFNSDLFLRLHSLLI
jgi:hypothetical protein